LADSVGLGKTFSALGVIKYYQERNRTVLVLCPKKLGDNWKTFLNNYDDNPLIKDRFNYDVLYHTDLSRNKGFSNGIDLSRINWGNYDLVVIDESHNFRNNDPKKDKVTRYQKLLHQVMQAGVKTKVLMLSATPVNNKFTDLKNQIALAYEGQTQTIDKHMDVSQSVDSVTIARSRKHIEKYYDMEKIGKFPTRLKPITHRSDITELKGFISITDLYQELSKLNLSTYSPMNYM